MKKRLLALLPFTLLLTACSLVGGKKTTTVTETITTTGTKTTTNSENKDDHTIIPEYDSSSVKLKAPDFTTREIPNKESVTYEDLFNLGNEVSISIDIEDSELRKLQEDLEYYTNTHCKNQLYRHVKSVTITLKNYSDTYYWTFEDVGIRQKGNTSRKDEWPILNDSGNICHLNHFKLSFDETFDDDAYGSDKVDWSSDPEGLALRKDREFLGLTGIDLKWNKNYDATHIKEVYASKLYKAAGLISQNTGLSNFEINQVDKNQTFDMGVYTLFEPAKKSLIKRTLQNEEIMNFGSWSEEKKGSFGAVDSKYGDLYKCAYGHNGIQLTYDDMNGNIGIGSMDGTYVPKYERKTNTSDDSYSDSLLKALGQAVSTKNIDNIRKKLDIEYFAAVEAVNYFVGNPDDLRNNTNNTMIYMRRSDGMGITIPIDNDRCFGITKDWDPDGNGMRNIGPMDTSKATGGDVISLYKNTILKKNSAANKLYLAYITAFYNSDWVKNSTFLAYYNMAKNTYQSSVSSDFDYLNFSLTDSNYSFSDYMSAKLNNCKSYLDGGSSNNNNNNNTTTTTTTTNNENDGYYGDIYVVGTMNGWDGKDYHFIFNGNGSYSVTFSPASVDGGEIQFKINNGVDWETIDWTIDLDNNLLDMDKGGNCVLTGLTTSSIITITINTITKEALVEVE